LTLGIGAGGLGWDATVLGQEAWPPRERADRFGEFIELTDQLLREPSTTATGRFYSAENAPMVPGCVQTPRLPFAIAATGPRGMRLAAQYGQTWVTTGDRAGVTEALDATAGAEVVRTQGRLLDDACAAIGRDPASISRLVLLGTRLDPGLHSVASFRDTVAQYANVGATDLVVHWPRSSPPFATDATVFERIVRDFASPY
jgi:alkanesulfonate monooxygenase SsuD/methylene tetrahydromethanopterin reductase-like flavin-dependent oxidoreductase (luciferase family)